MRKIPRPPPSTTLPAVAALLGAAVAGFFTYQASLGAQRAETERLDRRDDALARGAARVLIAELEDAQTFLANTANEKFTFPIDESATIDLPRNDAELLAAHMTPREWQELNITTTQIRDVLFVIRTYNRENHVSATRGGAPVHPRLVKVIDEAGAQIDLGRVALHRVADIRTTP